MDFVQQWIGTLVGKIVVGQIRHYVALGGMYMVTNGFWTKAQDQQAEGAILVLIPLVLSGYDKWKAQQDKNAAILAATKGNNNG